jgi:hypothetical protein
MKRAVAVLAALPLISGAVAGSAAGDRSPHGRFQVAALAIPGATGGYEPALELQVESTGARHVHLAADASASLTCDGCTGVAGALQVVSASRAASVTVRNVAAAWASDCDGCRGWAVSVQVVIGSSARAIDAGNRSLAVTGGCRHCDVSAAALQFVVIGASGQQLSGSGLSRLLALRDQLVSTLQATPAAPAGRGTARAGIGDIDATASVMANVLRNDLHAQVRQHLQVTRR